LRSGGTLPPELSDSVILLETGWSWAELMATPADVVDNVRMLLNKRALIIRERQREAEAR